MASQPGTRAQRFTDLFEAHHSKVLAYAARRLPLDGAKDAVAETFATAWRRLDDLGGDPLLWLYGIARRAVYNQRRASGRRARLFDRVSAQWPLVTPDHADHIGWAEPLADAIVQLRDGDQEVLRLTAWEGLSASQGAAVLGCSERSYRVRLHRARRRLRALLDADRAESASDLTCSAVPLKSGTIAISKELP